MLVIGMAVVICNHRILIAQRQKGRKQGLLWEFPGGKVEPGETVADCIRREMLEELGLPVTVGDFWKEVTFTYEDTGSVRLMTHWATAETQEIPYLTAHEQVAWVRPDELHGYSFCPADEPLVTALQDMAF